MTSVPRPDGTGRPHRLSAGERREHLLDVTAQIVIDRGVEAVTMESVAAAAGVSKGLGYAYFTNRGDLLLALLERELAELERRVLAAVAGAQGFEAQIRGALQGWFDVVEERGAVLGPLLQAGQIQESLRERHSVIYRGLEEFYGLLAVEAYGIAKPRSVAAAAILLAGLAGIVERWVETGDDRQMLEETFMSVTLGALERMAAEDGGASGA